MTVVDIDFISIGRFTHAFSQNKNGQDELSRELTFVSARSALELMMKYEVASKGFVSMMDYVEEIKSKIPDSDAYIDRCSLSTFKLKEGLASASSKDNILENTLDLCTRYILEERYSEAYELINIDSAKLKFQYISRDSKKIAENKYFKFMFFKYLTSLFHLLWFPMHDQSSNESEYSGNLGHLFSSIVSKSDMHFDKCKIFLDDQNTQEIHYYYLLKWLSLFVLFKKGMFGEYIDSFNALAYETTYVVLPLDVLNTSGIQIRSEILILLKISLLASKPFKCLSLLDYPLQDEAERELQFDFFDNDTLEGRFHNLIIPLASSRFKDFKESFNSSPVLYRVISFYAFLFSVSAVDFTKKLNLLVDFKNFVSILSATTAISKDKLLKLLGHKDDSAFDDLLTLLSVLNLGEMGVGYDYQNCCFFNSGQNVLHAESIDNLQNKIKGDSISTLIKGTIFAQVFSSN